jgi:hypothetical protein
MAALASLLIAASAAIPLVLGVVHLFYTYRGRMLYPRDEELIDGMKRTALVITRETTVWHAWIGFNATHSMSLILFGLFYGWLALAAPGVLLGSGFLRFLGLAILVAFVVLARRYFFSVPFRGVVLASALYGAGLVAAAL